ncbi:MAG: hypothetical protein AAFP82_16775 [Bacteroidota bacterium]
MEKSNGFAQPEDYVEMARALSLAKHEDAYLGAYSLIKAAIRGYDQIQEIETNSDFEYIKEVTPRNWRNFLRIVRRLPVE